MKTASIRVYQIFGTFNWCADITYRNKLLRRLTKQDLRPIDSELQGVKEKAIEWIKENNFTHYNITLG